MAHFTPEWLQALEVLLGQRRLCFDPVGQLGSLAEEAWRDQRWTPEYEPEGEPDGEQQATELPSHCIMVRHALTSCAYCIGIGCR